MPGRFADLDLTPNPLEQARQRQAAGAGYIDLTSSNPTAHGLLFPPAVLHAAAADFWETRRYAPDPRGLPRARAALAEWYATRTPPLLLTPDAFFLTASTSEAYSLLFALLTDPGDNVLAPNVTYPLFEFLAALHHVELRPYQLDERRGWQIDEGSLLAAADQRTRAVLLVSPHNPTGAIIAQSVPMLNQLGLPLVCDEVFESFTYGAPATPPLAALHPALPVFTLNGISKRFALPDMKLGWVALNMPAQTFAPRLELLNDTFLGANSLAQHMLPTLFTAGAPFVAAMTARVRASLETTYAQLEACSALTLAPPDGGAYLFPAVHGWADEEALVLYLLEQGVLVHPGFFYGDVPGTHILLSAITEPSQLAAGVARLVAALSAVPQGVARLPRSSSEGVSGAAPGHGGGT